MGVDAEILVRLRGDKPTDEQLTRWSWDLCASIGARHFFIGDGLPPDEYQAASDAWHAAYKSHQKYPEWQVHDRKQNVEKRNSVGDEIRASIGEFPQEMRRAIELTNRRYPLDDDSDVPAGYREPGKAWTQDGEPILAPTGEWFLEIGLFGRYYGEGYERGDILTYCAIAEWVEANIPNSEVWYGGDSSGVCAEPFGHARRAELRAHLYSANGRNYFKAFGRHESFVTPAPCGLCIPNENRFSRYGFGAAYVAVSCAGCGKQFVSRDNGETWQQEKNE